MTNRAVSKGLSEAQEALLSKSTPDPSGCRLWNGVKNDKGYGRFIFGGKNVAAHRASYSAFIGEIPEGLLICHRCDVPACIEPSHLFAGTASDNMKDMVQKGRGRNIIGSSQSHFKAGHAPRGAAASGARITERDAIEIIRCAADGELTEEIAARYGVHRTSIQRILRGANWKHLPRPAGLPRPTGAYSRAALASRAKED